VSQIRVLATTLYRNRYMQKHTTVCTLSTHQWPFQCAPTATAVHTNSHSSAHQQPHQQPLQCVPMTISTAISIRIKLAHSNVHQYASKSQIRVYAIRDTTHTHTSTQYVCTSNIPRSIQQLVSAKYSLFERGYF